MAKREKRPKHIPERTCLVCKQKRPKHELTRIVRTPDGAVEIDPRGKKAGRGAYLCGARSCWESGLKSGRISRALNTSIRPDDHAQLVAYAASLVPETVAGNRGT